MLPEMNWDEVCQIRSLEAFTLAGAEYGFRVHDWACPWPPQKPTRKLTRFASRPDFAPSVYYKSKSKDSAESNAPLYSTVNTGEYSPEYRKSTVHVVNVSDQAQDDGLTTLAPSTCNATADDESAILLSRTYHPTADDKITTLLPMAYHPVAGDETTTLLPRMYGATANDEFGSTLSIRRKPVSPEVEDKSCWTSAPSIASQNDVESENEDEDVSYDDDEDVRARSCVVVCPRVVARSVRYHSPGHGDAEQEQLTIAKKHNRGGSTGFLERVSNSGDKFVESHSDAEVVEKQMPDNSTTGRPLPANAGVLNRDFRLSFSDQKQRGISMPIFPSSAIKGGEAKKRTRRSSFGKLLNALGKKDNVSEESKTKNGPKRSLGRRVGQSVRKGFSSLWPK